MKPAIRRFVSRQNAKVNVRAGEGLLRRHERFDFIQIEMLNRFDHAPQGALDAALRLGGDDADDAMHDYRAATKLLRAVGGRASSIYLRCHNSTRIGDQI